MGGLSQIEGLLVVFFPLPSVCSVDDFDPQARNYPEDCIPQEGRMWQLDIGVKSIYQAPSVSSLISFSSDVQAASYPVFSPGDTADEPVTSHNES